MKSTIKILFITLISVLISFSLVYAQESESENPLEPGKYALQFQIGENFTLESFSGFTVSYKRQISDSRAKRIGIGLAGRFTLNDPDEVTDANDTKINSFLEIDYSWMNYIDPESDIKFYYGYGPRIFGSYNRAHDENDQRTISSRNINYGISAIGYTGVEWFFHSSMSIHAEYQASFSISQYRRRDTIETSTTTENNTVGTRLSLGGEGVNFGISVYF